MSDTIGLCRRPEPVPGVAPWLGADFWWCPPALWGAPPGSGAAWLTLPVNSPFALSPTHAPALLAGSWVEAPDALRTQLRAHLQTHLWGDRVALSAPGVRLGAIDEAPSNVNAPDSTDARLDRLEVDTPTAAANADMLQAAWDDKPVSEHLFTERLCMSDGRGGWLRARLSLDYSGPQIEPGSLMAYVLAWRHRSVALPLWADALASDIAQRCRPSRLSLQLHLASTDGGLAVHSWRTNHPQQPPVWARWLG
jgi:7-cyano-7-deazaguanine reductase